MQNGPSQGSPASPRKPPVKPAPYSPKGSPSILLKRTPSTPVNGIDEEDEEPPPELPMRERKYSSKRVATPNNQTIEPVIIENSPSQDEDPTTDNVSYLLILVQFYISISPKNVGYGLTLPILSQCSLFIAPKNIRKSLNESEY